LAVRLFILATVTCGCAVTLGHVTCFCRPTSRFVFRGSLAAYHGFRGSVVLPATSLSFCPQLFLAFVPRHSCQLSYGSASFSSQFREASAYIQLYESIVGYTACVCVSECVCGESTYFPSRPLNPKVPSKLAPHTNYRLQL